MKRSDISTLVVLEATKQSSIKNGATWECIQRRINAPEKVIYAAMEREDSRGFLEWGVSLRTAWLTDKGEAKLKELRSL